MLCTLRFLGGSKFTQIHKVGCHLAALTGCGGRGSGSYTSLLSYILTGAGRVKARGGGGRT